MYENSIQLDIIGCYVCENNAAYLFGVMCNITYKEWIKTHKKCVSEWSMYYTLRVCYV